MATPNTKAKIIYDQGIPDTEGIPKGLRIDENGQVYVLIEGMTFNSGKLRVDAEVSAGNIDIGKVHIADPITDVEAEVKDDGTDNALVVTANTLATKDNQTNGTAKGMVVDLDGHIVNVQAITGSMAGDEYGMITNAIIHGRTTAQGGGWVDVKVTPSGALTTETEVVSSALPDGAATSAKQLPDKHYVQLIDALNNLLVFSPRGQTPTGNVMQVQGGPGDVISNIPVGIDYDHHQIHEGETFRWSFYSASFAKNTNKDIRLVVPDITVPAGMSAVQICPHFRFETIYGDQGIVNIYETPTFTANGTQRTPIALERNGTYTPKLQIWEDPTTSVVGTLIWQGLLLGNKGQSGGLDNSMNEFVLKNNTSYLFRFTSGATDAVRLLIRMVFYEDLGV